MGSSAAATVIEQVLEEQGRSIRWLAGKAGVDVSYAWRMIHGERPMTDEFREAAVRVLGVPEHILFPAEAQAS